MYYYYDPVFLHGLAGVRSHDPWISHAIITAEATECILLAIRAVLDVVQSRFYCILYNAV